ncbi:MAG: histidine kinase, partial [Hyphomicrobium sp.]|nr:histidine kinase [Hyphomicrobium sp.]
TQVRARIYGRDGSLIVDSARFLTPGQISKSETPSDLGGKPKDFWTRLTQWLIDKDLPVYKEIGSGKGTAYKEVAAALKGAPPTPMLLLNDAGDQIVAVPVPIQRAKAVHGVLLLSTRPGEIDEILDEQRKVILWLAAMALAAAIVSSLLLDRTVAGPMRKLSDTAMAVSRNINQRHELPDYAERQDEVGQMARAFRSMTEALYRRIEASEKFAADVAHELKNPLTAARSTAESLTYAKTDAHRQELVDQIQIELKRLNRLITDVSKASRLDAELARQHTGPVALIDVLESVVDVMAERANGRGCNVLLRINGAAPPASFVVDGNDGRIAQVLTNLVDNAISFSPKDGTVEVIATRNDLAVEIAVEDQGPGIEEDKLAKIFERFYTYRPTTNTSRGDNSGLGLSISREIVIAHGGHIRAENRYAESNFGRAAGDRLGARFVVTLPAGRLPAPSRGGHGLGRRS